MGFHITVIATAAITTCSINVTVLTNLVLTTIAIVSAYSLTL